MSKQTYLDVRSNDQGSISAMGRQIIGGVQPVKG
jgi:hypothetical protein